MKIQKLSFFLYHGKLNLSILPAFWVDGQPHSCWHVKIILEDYISLRAYGSRSYGSSKIIMKQALLILCVSRKLNAH